MINKISILKFALKYFYPNKHHEIDEEHYKSKKEMYREWFNSNYINGSWYIGEDIDPIVATIERGIEEVFYIIIGEYRYHLGLRLNHFTSNQSILITIKATIDGQEVEYTYNGKLLEQDKRYIYLPLDEEITPSNITMLSLKAECVVENHIKYTPIERININNPQSKIMVVNKEEYDRIRKEDIILQKPKEDIQVMRYSEEMNGEIHSGLRIRNILPYYYAGEQYVKYNINNSNTGCEQISDNFSICCFNSSMSECEIIINVLPYGRYSGYKVKLEYEGVNGRSYINPSSVEYIK